MEKAESSKRRLRYALWSDARWHSHQRRRAVFPEYLTRLAVAEAGGGVPFLVQLFNDVALSSLRHREQGNLLDRAGVPVRRRPPPWHAVFRLWRGSPPILPHKVLSLNSTRRIRRGAVVTDVRSTMASASIFPSAWEIPVDFTVRKGLPGLTKGEMTVHDAYENLRFHVHSRLFNSSPWRVKSLLDAAGNTLITCVNRQVSPPPCFYPQDLEFLPRKKKKTIEHAPWKSN